MIVETPRGKFGVHVSGDGAPGVVALHPLALSGAIWDGAGDGAAARLGLAGLDARGHGDSSWDGEPFTVADMADDTAAVIEATASGPVGVIGLSMGGSTALALAARRPDLVSRLVIADGSACYGPDRVEQWAERARLAEGKPRARQLEFQRDRWFGPAFRAAHPETVARACEIFLRTNSAAHAAACRALGGLDATGQLGQITVPALVMVGSEDYATPPAMARAIAAGIPGAELMVLAGARHMSLIEQPSAWARIEAHLGG
ncbi:MAG TPA: alpha/beta fold hydrolase [Trebonia sp.]|jgi:3-oxoadipate enol-lactonase|nr:alpha/beta fold hydrolase [Trebonia sp.]